MAKRKQSAQVINFAKYRKPVRRLRKTKPPTQSRDERLAYGMATAFALKYGYSVRQTADLAEKLQDILANDLNFRFPKEGER